MNHTEMDNITAEFWNDISGLRAISRLVLAALAHDDVEEVERLSRESAALMEKIRPTIEARVASQASNEDDHLLKEMMAELGRMNQRILEELDERREQVKEELGRVRGSRLKLVHHRPSESSEPEFLNISR